MTRAAKSAPREPTMPRIQLTQKKLLGVFLFKSGETLVTFWFEPTDNAERAWLTALASASA
jgi:hypothetical protein